MSTHQPTTNRVAAGVPTGGQFAASAKGESGVTLTSTADAVAAPETPTVLRHQMQVREDQAFLDAMEAAATEVRVRDLVKGDWVRDFGSDEWGIVKNVGARTLTTDVWRDEDTDHGDHVVEVVHKDQGDAILAAHGALPTRAVNAYTKRKATALEVADDYDAASAEGDRRVIGYHRLRKAARDVWLSAVAANLATPSDNDYYSHPDTTAALKALEKAYTDYNSMMTVGGHSDSLADSLVTAMRGAVARADQAYAPSRVAAPLSVERQDLADFTANDLAELGDGETMDFHGSKSARVSVLVERKPVDGASPGVTKGSYSVTNHLTRQRTTIPFNNLSGTEGEAAKKAALSVHRLLAADDRA